jgi:hypothetical protein
MGSLLGRPNAGVVAFICSVASVSMALMASPCSG